MCVPFTAVVTDAISLPEHEKEGLLDNFRIAFVTFLGCSPPASVRILYCND